MSILGWVKDRLRQLGVSPDIKNNMYELTGQENVLTLLTYLREHFISEKSKELAELVTDFCKRRMELHNRGKHTAPYSSRDIEIFKRIREINSEVPNKEWFGRLNIEG